MRGWRHKPVGPRGGLCAQRTAPTPGTPVPRGLVLGTPSLVRSPDRGPGRPTWSPRPRPRQGEPGGQAARLWAYTVQKVKTLLPRREREPARKPEVPLPGPWPAETPAAETPARDPQPPPPTPLCGPLSSRSSRRTRTKQMPGFLLLGARSPVSPPSVPLILLLLVVAGASPAVQRADSSANSGIRSRLGTRFVARTLRDRQVTPSPACPLSSRHPPGGILHLGSRAPEEWRARLCLTWDRALRAPPGLFLGGCISSESPPPWAEGGLVQGKEVVNGWLRAGQKGEAGLTSAWRHRLQPDWPHVAMKWVSAALLCSAGEEAGGVWRVAGEMPPEGAPRAAAAACLCPAWLCLVIRHSSSLRA